MTDTRLTLDLADRLELGARLRRLRERTGLTTLQVAEEVLGYQGSHAAVSRLERGVFATINLEQLDSLAAFYGTDRQALLLGTEGSDTAPPPVVEEFSWGLKDVKPGVGGRIRDLRQAAGMSPVQFVDALGWAPSSVTHLRAWESGTTCPRPNQLLQVAAKFGVSGTWLILGQRARIAKPTQPMRVRAFRLGKGLSRAALALQANPEQFEETRRAISGSENRGTPIAPDLLAKLAQAFDVPVDFLDPEGTSSVKRPTSGEVAAEPSVAEAQFATEQGLSVPTRKLLEQIRTTAALGMLEASDTAWLLKELSRRLWRKPVQLAA